MAIYSDQEAVKYLLCNVSLDLLFLLLVLPFPLAVAAAGVLPPFLFLYVVPSIIDFCSTGGIELRVGESVDGGMWDGPEVIDLCGGQDVEYAWRWRTRGIRRAVRGVFDLVSPWRLQIFLLEIFGGRSREASVLECTCTDNHSQNRQMASKTSTDRLR